MSQSLVNLSSPRPLVPLSVFLCVPSSDCPQDKVVAGVGGVGKFVQPGAVGLTRVARLRANVVENVVYRHSFGESRRQGRYLGVYVGEPGRAGPSAQLHDEVAVDPI